MTDQRINAAIDTIKGYNNYQCWCDECHPDWCNDLNAIHEAEKVLNTLEQGYYWDHLKDLTIEGFDQLHATARQRAEAFLRTLGKWEEVQG